MNALVVFESSFGNTEAIAEAIAAGLSHSVAVTVVEVRDAPHRVPSGVDLVVVGGPTHAFGLSREETRQQALSQGAPKTRSARFGLRDWLEVLRSDGRRVAFAAFDTRLRRWWALGSAARAADRRLARAHLVRLARPMTFFVAANAGPLLVGEVESARAWGRTLGRELGDRATACDAV
jgi:hypothetical protein